MSIRRWRLSQKAEGASAGKCLQVTLQDALLSMSIVVGCVLSR
jgi:hypothetical protein